MAKRATDRIVLKNVIASFPHVFEPREKMSGEGMEYSIQVVIPKDHPQLGELKGKIAKLAKEAFPKVSPKTLKLGLRDNDAEGRSENDPRLEKTMFINARSKEAPQVVDRALRVLTDSSDFYAGCRMNISLSLFSYDAAGSKGISAGLNSIQVVERGERWDGRRSAMDDFTVLEGADEELGEEKEEAEAVSEEDDDLPWS